jgi:hypothetical protein
MTFLLIFSRSGEAALDARTILRCTQDTPPPSQRLELQERLLVDFRLRQDSQDFKSSISAII